MNVLEIIKRYTIKVFLLIMVVMLSYILKNRWQAEQIAQKYLKDKYEQDMKCLYVKHGFADPSAYYVWFCPQKNRDIKFKVVLNNDLTLCQPDESTSADNYYISNFEYLMKQQILFYIKDIWESPKDVNVFFYDPTQYAYTLPPDLDDTLSLEEMEKAIQIFEKQEIYRYKQEGQELDEFAYRYEIPYYRISIYAKDKGSKEEIALKLLDTFQMIKNNGFQPRYVVYSNLPLVFSNHALCFENWEDLTTVEQIKQCLEEDKGPYNNSVVDEKK